MSGLPDIPFDVRMEHTEGFGRRAEVWVDGTLLVVCDGISRRGRRCAPGPVANPFFRYTRDEGLDWNDAVLHNRHKRIALDWLEGWSYHGCGRVVSVMPVIVDFGLLTMEDPEWSVDAGLAGLFVAVPISRLEIVPPPDDDYPE